MLHKAFASLLVLALLAAPAFAAGAPAAADDAPAAADDAPSWSATLHGFFVQALELLGVANADGTEFFVSPEPGGSTVSGDEGSNELGASPHPGDPANEWGASPDPAGLTETDDDPSSEWGASPDPNG